MGGANSGRRLPPAPVHCLAHARLGIADAGTVYGVGFQGELNFSIPGTGVLRAYDASSGRFLWEEPVDVEAIGATGGVVVVLTPGASAPESGPLRATANQRRKRPPRVSSRLTEGSLIRAQHPPVRCATGLRYAPRSRA
jgi:hypothetical protein